MSTEVHLPTIQFTAFSVQHCLRVNYPNDVQYRPIHPMQTWAALHSVDGLTSFDEAERAMELSLSLLSVKNAEGEGVVVASERCEAYQIAHGGECEEISVCGGEYGGHYWRILAFVEGSDKAEDAYQMMIGDCEEVVRAACQTLQGLLNLPNAMRKHSEALNKAEVSPDGSNYNELLELAGV